MSVEGQWKWVCWPCSLYNNELPVLLPLPMHIHLNVATTPTLYLCRSCLYVWIGDVERIWRIQPTHVMVVLCVTAVPVFEWMLMVVCSVMSQSVDIPIFSFPVPLYVYGVVHRYTIWTGLQLTKSREIKQWSNDKHSWIKSSIVIRGKHSSCQVDQWRCHNSSQAIGLPRSGLSNAGVLNLFDPASTFGTLKQGGGHNHKMAGGDN